jgi:heme exporter protein D
MLIKDWEYWEDKLSMGHMALFYILHQVIMVLSRYMRNLFHPIKQRLSHYQEHRPVMDQEMN